jgi:hemerythrin
MKWIEEYATGNDRIDEQHRMIFKMAEDFRTSLDEGGGETTYGTLLDFLEHYIRAHFGYEDRCMVEYHCPAVEKNRQAHAKFIEILREFRQRYDTNGYRLLDAREIVDTLDDWLSKHILRIDITLKEYVGR